MASRLKKAIGEKLREFRHKRYYTQEYLAELVELDIKQIGRIERGESYLKPENLEKFCKVLKVYPKDFYDFEWQFEEENLAAANGTYGRYIGIKSDFGVEKAIDINENFESELDLVEYAYADKTIKTQAKQLNLVRTARYNSDGKDLFIAYYFPSGRVTIEYLDKEFEQLNLYHMALKNLNKHKNNIKFLKTINYLAQLEK